MLWWLDRMIRSRRPLQEKLTLFWHDHFATSDQDTPLMLAQNQTLRRHAMGSFPALLTRGDERLGDAPLPLARRLRQGGAERELRARADGAVHARARVQRARHPPGRRGRSPASAWTGTRTARRAATTTRRRTTPGSSRSSATRGHHDWQDVLRLCVNHPAHAPFLVGKLWDYFVGTPIPGGHPPPAWRRSTAAPATGSSRWWRGSSPTPRSTGSSTPPEWSSRRWCTSPAPCASAGQGIDATAGAGSCSRAWASTRSTRPPWRAGTGAPPGCRRTRCACASTWPTTCSTRRACA